MKTSHLYWHRTLNALKKIPSFFRDWEETVSAHNTPDLICECMEERPHLLAKHLAFLMSAPASDVEKSIIWTHIFIKALELGKDEIADLADKHIPQKGWTALACVPFNSPKLLKKYLHPNIPHQKDFKNILFNLALKHNAIGALSDLIGVEFEGCRVAQLSDTTSRKNLVAQIARHASGDGILIPTFGQRMDCALESADYIIDLAKKEDSRAYCVLKTVKYGRFKIFEKVAVETLSYTSAFQNQLVEFLPQWFESTQTGEEFKSMCSAMLNIMKFSASAMDEKTFVEIVQKFVQNKFTNEVSEVDEIFEHTPPELLENILTILSQQGKDKLSQCGPWTASLIQRHTLMKCTQSEPSTIQRRKM